MIHIIVHSWFLLHLPTQRSNCSTGFSLTDKLFQRNWTHFCSLHITLQQVHNALRDTTKLTIHDEVCHTSLQLSGGYSAPVMDLGWKGTSMIHYSRWAHLSSRFSLMWIWPIVWKHKSSKSQYHLWHNKQTQIIYFLKGVRICIGIPHAIRSWWTTVCETLNVIMWCI